MIRKILLVIALVFLMFSAFSCQTVQGVGGDIQWIGKKCGELLAGE